MEDLAGVLVPKIVLEDHIGKEHMLMLAIPCEE